MDLTQEFSKIHQRFDKVEQLEQQIGKLEKVITQLLNNPFTNPTSPILLSVKVAAEKHDIHPNTLRACSSEDDGRLKRYYGKGREILVDENELVIAMDRGIIKRRAKKTLKETT